MGWLQFVMELDSLDATDVENALLRLGACSVTLSDAGSDPVLEPGPGETPLWSRTCITGLFGGDTDAESLAARVQAELGVDALPGWCIEVLPDRSWEREWLKDFGPMRFGDRLWICPTQASEGDPSGLRPAGAEGPPTGSAVVRLDPGLAFGTGTHATTALCLEWLDGVDLEGRSVLDYGCGSGILAIAALKLGAGSATGMDIDPQAALATRENAAANDVRVTVCERPEDIEGRFDVVLANILAGPLVEFADSITARLTNRGMLALSGVLCEQADEVMAAYDTWIEFAKPDFRDQGGQTWSRLTGRRKD
ncbi:MAG: 50S ribosomal protein L11 methyltransferase [Gammaproteobacteria bacterium]|nr:50S ribosomal protein L11 methyltransferase [Gammaproteobacteria bacterium]NNF49462.1 50S ribosomal protein L11 methyltransferase [Woeseiaceae bacterium]MBT8095310.1 50S ribosomal protein L11 methyltransferase [Gammaproteobacteria bacterium]MBT8105927.1 50S ribosomal protein L11 methyltransferase [Gammaproteobacteria bacterium]NNK25941.1 50S ribosomal protein L11 methyltransferase [Woeseiaceae bacterium]